MTSCTCTPKIHRHDDGAVYAIAHSPACRCSWSNSTGRLHVEWIGKSELHLGEIGRVALHQWDRSRL